MAKRQQVVLPGVASAIVFQNKAQSLVVQPNLWVNLWVQLSTHKLLHREWHCLQLYYQLFSHGFYLNTHAN